MWVGKNAPARERTLFAQVVPVQGPHGFSEATRSAAGHSDEERLVLPSLGASGFAQAVTQGGVCTSSDSLDSEVCTSSDLLESGLAPWVCSCGKSTKASAPFRERDVPEVPFRGLGGQRSLSGDLTGRRSFQGAFGAALSWELGRRGARARLGDEERGQWRRGAPAIRAAQAGSRKGLRKQ